MEPGQTAGTPHYYALLEVSPDADGVTIQAAFRRQVRRFHPDVNPHPDAAALMRDLNAAYAVLGNPERRASYDTSHGVSWGGAVSSVMHGTGTAPSRTVGVRASGGAYAPRCGHVVGVPGDHGDPRGALRWYGRCPDARLGPGCYLGRWGNAGFPPIDAEP